jgi:hypothetical protein
MIVECFGLPGAGKTHVVERLIEKGLLSTVPAYSRRIHSVFFAAAHPLFFARFIFTLVRECARVQSWRLFRFKISVFLNTSGRLWTARHVPHEVKTIIDEGLLQRLLSLYESKQSPGVFERWISHMPKSDAVAMILYKEPLNDGVRVGTIRRSMGISYEKQWRDVMIHNHTSIMVALEHRKIRTCIFYKGDDAVDSIEKLSQCLNAT